MSIQLRFGLECASSAISAVMQSSEIIGILKSKDDMPVDLDDSLKADEEDRKSNHATLVAVTENDEVATLTATIETNLQQGDFETGVGSLFGCRPSGRRSWQKSRAGELRSRSLLRRSSPQSVRRFFVAVRHHGWMCTEGAVVGLRKRRRQHGLTCPQLHGNAVRVFFWVV